MRWAIDLGNTRIKLGAFVAGRLREVHTWRNAEEEACLEWLLTQESAGYALLSTAAARAHWRERLAERAEVYVYAPGQPYPLRIAYATPETLGHDRLAAAAGAYAMYEACDCLVIDAGTCITTEYVGADGVYRGGNISPGVAMRLRAMHAFTGKLPLVAVATPPTHVGTSTAEALQNGALRGAAGELSAAIVAFRQNAGGGRVVLCGGDAPFLRPLLSSGLTYRPTLVLEGLANMQAYAQSTSGSSH